MTNDEQEVFEMLAHIRSVSQRAYAALLATRVRRAIEDYQRRKGVRVFREEPETPRRPGVEYE